MPETWKEIKARLKAIAKQPRPQDAAISDSSPHRQIRAKLRIEGETKEDVDAIALLLQQTFDVLEESRDYPNKGSCGIRRYLTVRVTSYESIDIS